MSHRRTPAKPTACPLLSINVNIRYRASPPPYRCHRRPGSGVDHENSIPGERLMLRLPRRAQMAKRPRLDLAPSGGGGVTALSVQAQQTLAPPPVFRRRPPTPFNRPPGGTGGTGDQAEGSGYVEGNGNDEVEAGGNSPNTSLDLLSDDSLNLLLPRRRRVRSKRSRLSL
ncbi:hypothetical protein BDM02DRAFT_394585 [Thelephora ganbajun]|uniref:Uncharacterized protein n=1 Tax=Thelephora ganbajun TaxID=370292 RepID=A0ACB6Z954_THEGA|nr:hypothetical protein BDM02DRAFT_394585 [Thelephora ganbajun]